MGCVDAEIPTPPRTTTGILVVNKPSGITSRKVVDHVVRLLPRTKVGHAGTLDPLASGILLVCVGSATRLVEELQRLPKVYRAGLRLGARSDTLDADGQVVEVPSPGIPSSPEIEHAVQAFSGDVVQTPPDYSALRIKGRRAYDLARAGHRVELAPRTVRIERVTVLRYAWPNLELEIECGSGTFIRSIARDLGEALGCGGLIDSLVRTRVGPFAIECAVGPAELSTESLDTHLRPGLDAVPGMARVVLDARQIDSVSHGRRVPAAELGLQPAPGGMVALLDTFGSLVALGDVDPTTGWVQPRKVLV
jgi:tRNA pseudouridine55 synthase